MDKEILILGANGQLGSDLYQECINKKLSVLAWSRQDYDILHDNITEKLSGYNFKYILNCIAITNVDGCEDNPDLTFNVNTNFAYFLAKYCHEKNIILFHISTDYVFDGKTNIPYSETDRESPLNIYGLSKFAGEIAIKNYHDKYFIFRVSALFGRAGASGKGGNFITTMQRLAKELEQVGVIADQITCPTATVSVAKCILSFIEQGVEDYGIYNCVSSNYCSWFDFAHEIFLLSGLDEKKIVPKTFTTYKFKAHRPKFSALSINKLQRYYKMPTWQEGLKYYFAK